MGAAGKGGLMEHPVVLFDGVCNLCNDSVKFIIRRDPRARFRFAALQSEAGQRLLKPLGEKALRNDSVVLVTGGRFYTRTSASLRIALKLTWPWPMMGIFLIVPPFLRDPVYDFIGRNRYKWFGRMEACMIPTPELKERVL